MKIKHMAIYVNDLEKMKNFYIKYFNGVANNKYHNKNTGLETYFLTFPHGEVSLELMTRPNVENLDKTLYRSGFIHLAFGVGSKEMVDEITAKLKEDGYSVISGPRTTGDGYYESCIFDPEKNQIEITE